MQHVDLQEATQSIFFRLVTLGHPALDRESEANRLPARSACLPPRNKSQALQRSLVFEGEASFVQDREWNTAEETRVKQSFYFSEGVESIVLLEGQLRDSLDFVFLRARPYKTKVL